MDTRLEIAEAIVDAIVARDKEQAEALALTLAPRRSRTEVEADLERAWDWEEMGAMLPEAVRTLQDVSDNGAAILEATFSRLTTVLDAFDEAVEIGRRNIDAAETVWTEVETLRLDLATARNGMVHWQRSATDWRERYEAEQRTAAEALEASRWQATLAQQEVAKLRRQVEAAEAKGVASLNDLAKAYDRGYQAAMAEGLIG